MTLELLGESYFKKAKSRLKILPVLLSDSNYSDVIRESQEIVELALKGALRKIGIEPPKIHDVGPLVVEHRDKFPAGLRENSERLAAISKWLRKEREFSFYGDVDLIPTEEYNKEDALRAMADATFTVECLGTVFTAK